MLIRIKQHEGNIRSLTDTKVKQHWSWVKKSLWVQPYSTYAKFSEKLTFFIPWYAH